jgi:hypothetical protein
MLDHSPFVVVELLLSSEVVEQVVGVGGVWEHAALELAYEGLRRWLLLLLESAVVRHELFLDRSSTRSPSPVFLIG